MNDEPPSTSAESGVRLSIRKKIRDKIKKVYQNFSYKPQNKQELAGSIRDSSERGVLEKGTLNMIEGALRVSTDKVRNIMIPKPQMVYVDSNEGPKEFLPRVVKSGHSRFPVINTELDEIEGILLAKDLLPFFSSQEIDNYNFSGINLNRMEAIVAGKIINKLSPKKVWVDSPEPANGGAKFGLMIQEHLKIECEIENRMWTLKIECEN